MSLGTGLALSIALGAVVGEALFDNMAAGAVGLCLGVTLGQVRR
ncbi:hypothetical protein [Geminicoccus flavidas]|nr:hypothetical protein [Geminicoccus flavidas]